MPQRRRHFDAPTPLFSWRCQRNTVNNCCCCFPANTRTPVGEHVAYEGLHLRHVPAALPLRVQQLHAGGRLPSRLDGSPGRLSGFLFRNFLRVSIGREMHAAEPSPRSRRCSNAGRSARRTQHHVDDRLQPTELVSPASTRSLHLFIHQRPNGIHQ